MLKDEFLKLDFTPNQVDIYTTLLEIGPTRVAQLITKTRFHRTIVYRVLEELIDRKLVYKTSRKGVAYFAPSDPKSLTLEYKQKGELAEELIDKLRSKKIDQPEILVLTGTQGIADYLDMNLSSNTEIVLLGIDYVLQKEYADIYQNYEKRLLKKGIKRYVLAYPQYKNEESLMKNVQTRYLPKSFPKSPLVIGVFGESVSNVLWTKPALITVTKSKAIAQAYRDYFWLLWKLAGKGK